MQSMKLCIDRLIIGLRLMKCPYRLTIRQYLVLIGGISIDMLVLSLLIEELGFQKIAHGSRTSTIVVTMDAEVL